MHKGYNLAPYLTQILKIENFTGFISQINAAYRISLMFHLQGFVKIQNYGSTFDGGRSALYTIYEKQ